MLYELWILAVLGAAAVQDYRNHAVMPIFASLIAVSGLVRYGWMAWQLGSPAPLLLSIVAGLVLWLAGAWLTQREFWGRFDEFVIAGLGCAFPTYHVFLPLFLFYTPVMFTVSRYVVTGENEVPLVPGFFLGVAVMVSLRMFGFL